MIGVGHFWGFQADQASLGRQRRLTAEINQRTLRPVSVSLYPNLPCLAPYSEDKEQSSSYYRAKILHLRGNSVEVNTCSPLTTVSRMRWAHFIPLDWMCFYYLTRCVPLTVICTIKVIFLNFDKVTIVVGLPLEWVETHKP